MKKKDEIRARLTVHGMGEMTAKEFNGVRRWIKILAKEMQELPQKAYTKNPRWTIYKV